MNGLNSTNDHIYLFHALFSKGTKLLSITKVAHLLNPPHQYSVRLCAFYSELIVAIHSLIQDHMRNE